MSSSKKKRDTSLDYKPRPGYELVSIELESDVYFWVLEIALRERKTIDQVVNEALRKYLDMENAKLKKKKKKTKTNKANKDSKKTCHICDNSGFVIDEKITFGNPGYIKTKKKCPMGCKHA